QVYCLPVRDRGRGMPGTFAAPPGSAAPTPSPHARHRGVMAFRRRLPNRPSSRRLTSLRGGPLSGYGCRALVVYAIPTEGTLTPICVRVRLRRYDAPLIPAPGRLAVPGDRPLYERGAGPWARAVRGARRAPRRRLARPGLQRLPRGRRQRV